MKNQTFGIEIETTGLGCERTAKAIAAHFGTTARYVGRHLGDWHIPMPDGRKWVVERDASVTDPCAEVVSPVCHWEDIEMVQEVVRAIREAGARADSSCGIHVHVGFGEHTPASLRRLVNIVNAKEDLLTMALGISQHRREEWCRPVDQRFLEALNRAKPDTLESFAAIWYRHNSEAGYYWEMLARHHYDHSFSYLPGALAPPDITAIRTASSTHILSDLSTTNLCFRYPLCYNIITFHPGSYPAGHRFESYLSHTRKP